MRELDFEFVQNVSGGAQSRKFFLGDGLQCIGGTFIAGGFKDGAFDCGAVHAGGREVFSTFVALVIVASLARGDGTLGNRELERFANSSFERHAHGNVLCKISVGERLMQFFFESGGVVAVSFHPVADFAQIEFTTEFQTDLRLRGNPCNASRHGSKSVFLGANVPACIFPCVLGVSRIVRRNTPRRLIKSASGLARFRFCTVFFE